MRITFPLRSPRLIVRPFEEDDVEAMQRVYGDPEVMRFVGDGMPASPERTTEMLRGYRRHQAAHGFAFWAVVDLESGQLIGDAGLEDTGGQIELGYTLGRAWWGRGLATEVGRLCIEAAFGPLDLERLVGVSDAANPASARVLTKLGFQLEDTFEAFGRPHLHFELQRDPSQHPGRD